MDQSTLDTAVEEASAPQDNAAADAPQTAPEGGADAQAAAAPAGTVVIPQPELGASLSQGETPEGERREVANGRAYEIIFITRADDADATETSTQRARDLIEGAGGAIDSVRVSEVRRLAYPIKREIEGVYTVLNTRFAADQLPEIDRFFKLEESVLRHMILREED